MLLLIRHTFNVAPQVHTKTGAYNTAAAVPDNTTCEWMHDPIGVAIARPRFGWILGLTRVGERDVKQSGYRILVASSPQLLASGVGDVWDSGTILSPRMFGIEYEGAPLSSHTPYYWKVRIWDNRDFPSRWSAPARFTTALLEQQDWTAHWIAATPDSSSIHVENPETSSVPLPIFRKNFTVRKRVAQALLFVSGLGQYEAHIDGHNVTDAVVTPGWTDYKKRVFYDTYEVTRLLHVGDNAIGVMLGNGMYNVEEAKGRYAKFTGSFGQPKLILQMYLRFTDGSHSILVSDGSWKTAPGPIIFSSTYGGEDYDARREQAGWDKSGFDDRTWTPALEVAGPGGKLVSEQIPLVQLSHSYKPVKLTQPQPGIFVYDLGQNFAGWPKIEVRGAKGSWVKLVPGELLDAHGFVTQNTANGTPASPDFLHLYS